MKLTIKNIERLSGLGDFNSPYIVTNPTVHDDRYEILMQYEGRSWNVILYRDKHPAHNYWDMVVQLQSTQHMEATRMTKQELESRGITLAIVELLMNKIIEKLKI
jgi:hypothetical protein